MLSIAVTTALLVGVWDALGAEWSLERATRNLDERQRQWSEWKPAQAQGGACISCHTGLPYLLARPIIRKSQKEASPTVLEEQMRAGLLSRLREPASMFRGFTKEPLKSQGAAVEAVIAALVLPEEPAARERLWALQTPDGNWPWFHLKLDPWESEHSSYYGATLAALAIKEDKDSKHAAKVRLLEDYLRREASKQPLHNRLMLLWASTRRKGLLDTKAQTAIIDETLAHATAGGGWPIRALGPWSYSRHAGSESNAYATAFAAYVLRQTSACREPKVTAALDWLRRNQDAASGAWLAPTMTKTYPSGSMQEGFLNDAATAFAVMALLDKSCAE